MAKEEKAAAGAEPKDEVDVVRAAIWFLGILIVGLAVVLVFLRHQRDGFREAVDYGEKNLKAMATQYEAVRGLVKQYRDSGADEARRETWTWLQTRFKAAGIQEAQVKTEKWSERPSKDHVEHYVDVSVKGVRREQAIHFLWNVERMSTKMRTIELKLSRTAPANTPEADAWELRASFGYRVPRGFKEGS